MFVETFIKRPVVAIVCAIAIILIGIVTITTLPIAQYPQIAPPQVQVTAIYTGASAQVVESTVTNILEQELNGIEGIRYISSSSTNSGASAITLTFENDRDIDLAAVDVQNRIASVQAQLPVEVQRTGVNVRKQSANFLMALAVYTPDNTYDRAFLSNYTDLYIAEALKRIRGVSGIQIFGERRYAMRLWLDPERLASRRLTIQDVIDSLNEQNIQIGAGQIGQSPNAPDQDYQLDLEAFSRFTEVSQFAELVLDTAEDGSLVRLQDVGRVELGAEDYNTQLRFRGQDGVGLGVSQLPGSNALTVAKAVKAEMASLAEQFPPGMTYDIGFDTTAFVEASMTEVVWSLIQAIALVVLIIYVFLQDWRTTLIPAITIPTSLIGTFLFVKLFGFSINTLTLFGLTLATGMVVDDAIIVVENTFRLIQDDGMRPYPAAVQSMRELTGAVIATSLVLMAVFIPVAFFPGTTGALYRQFALTIAFSIAVSTFLALTFTPSVSALLLRANPQVPWPLRSIFDLFNRFLEQTEQGYGRSLQTLMRWRLLMVGFFAVALGATAWIYLKVPQGFLPEEDQGYFITLVQAPEGVSLNYTSDVVAKVEAELLKVPEVQATFGVAGFSFTGSSASNGIVFSPLKPWKERQGPNQSVQAIIGQLFPTFMGITEARIFPVNPPAINGLGTFGGFTFQLQDRRGVNDLDTLVQTAGQIIGQANQDPVLQPPIFTSFAASTPKLDIEVNREAAKALQIPIDAILRTIQASVASQYVNDFTLGQRNYRVYVQADEPFRDDPGDLNRLYVRSETGQLFTVGSFITTTPSTGARSIDHFNLHRSIEINGGAAPGQSSGDAIASMEAIAAEILPPGLSYEWAGTSAEEVDSGGQAPFIFGLGLVFVFLVLAAQYENFIDPLIIMLAVPLAVLGALLAQSARGLINDVYCQVGLVMLIGLASKNAILIVEFANQLQEQGMALVNAAVMAARERLRPILMTAISTLCGIFPLVVATGAGAGSRQALGTAVFGGMFLATFLTLFMVPVLYVVILSLQARLGWGQKASAESKFSGR